MVFRTSNRSSTAFWLRLTFMANVFLNFHRNHRTWSMNAVKKNFFVFEKMICGIKSMLCHHLKYPYLWKQSPYSLTCLLWILLWHLGKIMNFNEWLYMLCVSDCIIASVGSIKSKDCLCIVATINVTHSFFKMCIWFKKRSVLWHHI